MKTPKSLEKQQNISNDIKIERRNENILDRLDKLTWTGRISNSTIGLIVPFKIAYEEMLVYYPNMTEGELRTVVLKNNIVILNKPDDLEKYRGKK